MTRWYAAVLASRRVAVPGVLQVTLLACGCSTSGGGNALGAARAAEVDRDVRAFAQTVAQDVTRDGPTAWKRHFAENGSFFMAVNGSMQFRDGASAFKGIDDLPRVIKQIELKWGDDLRVDPLASDLAVMAASYHEAIENADGSHTDAAGFFTGTAENRGGQWKFRNAHWSQAVPAPAAR